MSSFPSIRIEGGLLGPELLDQVIVADGAFGWDDLGSWTALGRHLKADSEGIFPPFQPFRFLLSAFCFLLSPHSCFQLSTFCFSYGRFLLSAF